MKRTILASILPALLLTACNKSSESDKTETSENNKPNSAASSFTNIKVVDGYLANANIYIDKNNDGAINSDEFVGNTNERGEFKIKNSDITGPIVATSVPGQTKDLDLPAHIDMTGFKLFALKGTTIVSPLSELIYEEALKLKAGSTDSIEAYVEQATQSVLNELSPILNGKDIDLRHFDFIAEKSGKNADVAQKLHKVAQSLVEAEKNGNNQFLIELLPYFVDEASALTPSQLGNEKLFFTADYVDLGDGFGYVENVDTVVRLTPIQEEFSRLYENISKAGVTVGDVIPEQTFELDNLFSDEVTFEIVNTSGNTVDVINGISITTIAAVDEVLGESDVVHQAYEPAKLIIQGFPNEPLETKFVLKVTESVSSGKGRVAYLDFEVPVKPKYALPVLTEFGTNAIESLSERLDAQFIPGSLILVGIEPERMFQVMEQERAIGEKRYQIEASSDLGSFLLIEVKDIPSEFLTQLHTSFELSQEQLELLDNPSAWILLGNISDNANGQYPISIRFQHEVMGDDGSALAVVSTSLEKITDINVIQQTYVDQLSLLESQEYYFKSNPIDVSDSNLTYCRKLKFENGELLITALPNNVFTRCNSAEAYIKVGNYAIGEYGIEVTRDQSTSLLNFSVVNTEVEALGQIQIELTDIHGVRSKSVGYFNTPVSDDPLTEDVNESTQDYSHVIEEKIFQDLVFLDVTEHQKDAESNPLYLTYDEGRKLFTVKKNLSPLQIPSSVSIRAVYEEGTSSSEPALYLEYGKNCELLDITNDYIGGNSPKLSMSYAYSSTGDVIPPVNALDFNGKCRISYDLTQLGSDYILGDFFDIHVKHKPDYIDFVDFNRMQWMTSDGHNYHRLEKLRAEFKPRKNSL
ncbi:hypothetical protein [Vibrio nigripulchritudo]|uniref:hypothetical protein n=1 Tax=Vibrio nigripulchritudo TaxID=28173 RepID=UPI0024924652|nr:hypothetical protein [Vibrio nigripulchritudo]BDU37712.1 hypothetical protein TUMSATVNIG2_21810 [Vibrio nigripulchritudo]BDU43432.1 hypothetical protein TUMSATVNIG3_22300 [Vibrio nigripulchritudo]